MVDAEAPSIDVATFQLRVRPDLEFILPYGAIRQQADITVGEAHIGTRADFDIPESAVSGEVSLRRRIGIIEPRIAAFLSSATEPLARPRLSDGTVEVSEQASFFRRERGVDGSLLLYPIERLNLSLGVRLSESIETTPAATGGEPVRAEQFGIGMTAAVEITSLRIPSPRQSAALEGAYLRVSLTQRFNGSLERPVALSGRIQTLWHHTPLARLTLEHQFSAATPFRIFDREFFSPLVLGGYDTVRGYSTRSLSQVRGFSLRNTARWNAVPAIDSTVAVPGNEGPMLLRIHSLNLLAAVDAAIGQEEVGLTSAPSFNLGSGPGFSVTISAADRVHLEVRAMVVWPIEIEPNPAFYVQGAIYAVSSGDE